MMNQEEKIIKKENFVQWVTFLEDRIDQWKSSLPLELREVLDYGPHSLSEIESYILSNFSLENFNQVENKAIVDAIVSYFGETLRRNLPDSVWDIELEDESSINFNLPCVKTQVGFPINPYGLLRRIIKKNSGDFLKAFYANRLNLIENPDTY